MNAASCPYCVNKSQHPQFLYHVQATDKKSDKVYSHVGMTCNPLARLASINREPGGDKPPRFAHKSLRGRWSLLLVVGGFQHNANEAKHIRDLWTGEPKQLVLLLQKRGIEAESVNWYSNAQA
jgi:hypothetical protein